MFRDGSQRSVDTFCGDVGAESVRLDRNRHWNAPSDGAEGLQPGRGLRCGQHDGQLDGAGDDGNVSSIRLVWWVRTERGHLHASFDQDDMVLRSAQWTMVFMG